MNNVSIVGRLTKDPEKRTTTVGKEVASFSVAVQKAFKPTDGSPNADFFNIVAWGKDANYATEYLYKGRLVSITGRLQSRRYQASDGSNREVVEIVVGTIAGLDRPRDDQGQGGDNRGQARAGRSADQQRQARQAADEYDPFADE